MKWRGALKRCRLGTNPAQLPSGRQSEFTGLVYTAPSARSNASRHFSWSLHVDLTGWNNFAESVGRLPVSTMAGGFESLPSAKAWGTRSQGFEPQSHP